MTHIVTEICIKCKYTDCVDVCPVDCFYEGENMLVINPQECIDCGVCIPECPIGAITDDNIEGAALMVEHHQRYAALWPRITQKKPPPADADAWRDAPHKLRDHFSPQPGGK